MSETWSLESVSMLGYTAEGVKTADGIEFAHLEIGDYPG